METSREFNKYFKQLMPVSEEIARNAREAGNVLKTVSNHNRSQVLYKIHNGLEHHVNVIHEANMQDLKIAREKGLADSLLKRLDLFKGDKFNTMLKGIKEVAVLPDPIGKINFAREIDEGLTLYQVTAPVGVLLVIFESRPEVIANITSLSIKSGNACILKGGKESTNTFRVMAGIINDVISENQSERGVPVGSVQLVETRENVSDLLEQDKYIDLVIPRGSNALVRNIKSCTKIPVLGHADGICSIYLDESADLEKAKRVVLDAKTNYPAGCNAMETLLINRWLNGWYEVLENLVRKGNVTLHATEDIKAAFLNTMQRLGHLDTELESRLVSADTSKDFDREFLSLDCAVIFVSNTQEAIEHINLHSSKHTDCIVTENKTNAGLFLKGIDSASVYWNVSTRFADGFRYGFGTEVGISTSKIHARGPVGLDGLVTYQYQLKGSGQIAGDYQGAGGTKIFLHKDLNVHELIE